MKGGRTTNSRSNSTRTRNNDNNDNNDNNNRNSSPRTRNNNRNSSPRTRNSSPRTRNSSPRTRNNNNRNSSPRTRNTHNSSPPNSPNSPNISQTEICQICRYRYNNTGRQKTQLSCGHHEICKKCINTMCPRETSCRCPFCRRSITNPYLSSGGKMNTKPIVKNKKDKIKINSKTTK